MYKYNKKNRVKTDLFLRNGATSVKVTHGCDSETNC